MQNRFSRKSRRLAVLLQAGTALPLLISTGVHAQAISEVSPSDIVVDEASAAGTPRAVSLSSTGGSVNATVESVTATSANQGYVDPAIYLRAADTITGNFGSIAVTGTGEVAALSAFSNMGDVVLSVGEVTVDGARTAGIVGSSADSDVSIEVDSVVLNGTGGPSASVAPDTVPFEYYPDGVVAVANSGTASIVAGSVVTHGQFGSAAAAYGASAAIAIDLAEAYSDGAATIYIQAYSQDAAVTAGNVVMHGDGAGIDALSDAGGVTVAVGDVVSGGRGIYADAFGPASITYGSVTSSATGIIAIGQSVSVSDAGPESFVDAGFNGIYAEAAQTVDIAIAGSVTTSGNTGSAIKAVSPGTTTIVASDVAVTGPGAFPGLRPDGYRIDQGGIVVDGGAGAISIDAGTVTVEGQERYGITARGGGSITIVADDVRLESADSVAVVARGGTGDVSITTGNVVTTGASGVGVFGDSTTGTVTINAGTTRVENTGMQGPFTGDAVVGTSDSGAVFITSNDASSAALYGSAIVGASGGDVSILSGLSTTTGAGGANLYAVSNNANVVIDASEIVSTASNSQAVAAYAANDVTVTVDKMTTAGIGIIAESDNGGTVNVALASGQMSGNLGSAILATGDGAINISTGDLLVTGPGADPGGDGNGMRILQGGIVAFGGVGPVTVDAGTVDVKGQYRYAIAVDAQGPITIAADSVSNTSDDSLAVAARGGAGAITIDTGTVIATGVSGSAILGEGDGDVTINANVTRAEGQGQVGPFTGDAVIGISSGGTVSITSQNAFSAGEGGSAVVGIGSNVAINSNIAETTGDGGLAVYAVATAAGGTATVNAATINASGVEQRALYAQSTNGLVDVTVGDVTANTESATALGVTARGFDSNVTVNGSVVSGGVAVISQSLGGASTVNIAGSVTSALEAGVSVLAQNGEVTVADGASIEAARAGVVFTNLSSTDSGTMHLINRGSITGSVAAYVNPNPQGISPDVHIFNDGTLTGTTSAYAVITGAGDDSLELTENAIVNGVVDLGGGASDILSLGFNQSAAADAVGRVAESANVEFLSVNNGTWLADTGNSTYQQIAIDAGSRLIVSQENGFVSVEAPLILLDGQLDLALTSDTEPGDLTGLVVQGTGSLHLTGPATLLVDDASGLQYSGGTFVESGTLLLTDVFDGDITTSGDGVFQLGDGGTSGDFAGDLVNNGTFVFARSDSYTLNGSFTGSGQLDKYGAGTLYFGGFYDFLGTTTVYDGVIGFAGTIDEDTELVLDDGGAFDLSQVEGGEAEVAELEGTGGELVLGDIAFTVNQDSDTTFAGSISGTGTFVKEGTGDLKLSGDSDFSGEAQVGGGTLSVNGDYSSANFTVQSGGTLGGSGTLGSTSVSGGTFAPGNSIDTITIAGNLAFTASSTFEVEVNAAGQGDRVNVTGAAALGGATVNVLAAQGLYAPVTDYTILTAAGGISGTFGAVNSNLAFLDPSLLYSTSTVTLRLARNDVDYSSYATTGNQATVGNLIEALGFGNALYDATLVLDRSSVASSFATLTGEVYPAFGTALVEFADLIRRETDDAMVRDVPGSFIWGAGVQGQVDGDGGTSLRDIELNGAGILAGVGVGSGKFSAAIGGGEVWYDPKDAQLQDAGMSLLVGQAGWGGPAGLTAKVGFQLGWFDGDATRQTTLGTISQTVAGEFDGVLRQYYGEVSYKAAMGGFMIEPFAGIRRIDLNFDDFAETGGSTALTLNRLDREIDFADFGLRIAGTGAIAPYASGNLRRAWGDREGTGRIAFAGSSGGLGIAALGIDKSAVQAGAGVAYRGGRIKASLGYEGSFSDTAEAHGLRATVSVGF